MTNKVVTLNGADEVGKTTHLSLLEMEDSFEIIPNLSVFCNNWGKEDSKGRKIGGREWWFAKDNTHSFLNVLYSGLIKRAQYISHLSDEKIALVDRGTSMVVASMVASACIKDNSSREIARRFVHNIIDFASLDISTSDVLLKAPGSIHERITSTMKKTGIDTSAPFFSIYEGYQSILQAELDFLEQSNKFHKTTIVNSSAIEIQNEIRSSLMNDIDIPIPLLAQKINVVFGVAGLSESGKSTFCDIAHKEHGFMRLKQSYFAEEVPYKNFAPYQGTPREQAIRIFSGLEKFSRYHHFQKNYTIESIRDVQLASETKNIMGSKFMIVYMDLPRDVASQRSAQELRINLNKAAEVVKTKDLQKNQKGCGDIRLISDFLIDNTASIFELKSRVSDILCQHNFKL